MTKFVRTEIHGNKVYVYYPNGTIKRIVDAKDYKPTDDVSKNNYTSAENVEEMEYEQAISPSERRKRLLNLIPHKQIVTKSDGLDKEISIADRRKTKSKSKTKRTKKCRCK